jgi:hypothetical protein
VARWGSIWRRAASLTQNTIAATLEIVVFRVFKANAIIPPLATFDFAAGAIDAALEFLKRTRWELRALRKVHVYSESLRIFDINGDCFEVRGIGYPDADIVPLLRAVNTAFDPQTIHDATKLEYKEFLTGRRYTWAQDRVM